jgi:hypothetical protein
VISEGCTVPDIHHLGDFNYPNMDWEHGTVGVNTASQGRDLAEFIDHNFLTQVVDSPTRGSNTLDLVLTNVPRYVSEVKA